MKKCFYLLSIILLGVYAGALTGFNKPMTGQDEPVAPFPEGMVLIPSGDFEMGSEDAGAYVNQQPIHTVYVDAFYMDKYEVTNVQYAEFLNEMGKHSEGGRTWWYNAGRQHAQIEWIGDRYEVRVGYENHPVTMVSWYGAMAYAAWAGKRLPTEAEWEKAARGGLSGARYPWGNADADATHANFNNNVGAKVTVGTYRANGYGLHDMAGNVAEWCLDEYNESFYAVSAARNPLSGAPSIQWLLDNYTGVSVNSYRVRRGGAWSNDARLLRVAVRVANATTTTFSDFGFRCVRAVSPLTGQDEPVAPLPEGMVFIPAGEFEMGEKPVHTVYVDAFYMDKYEVTNAQYAVFLNEKSKHREGHLAWYNAGDRHARIALLGDRYEVREGYENHPVIDVTWYGAMAYAAWAGKRLPTEAEWEYAARGGLSGARYPWGNADADATVAKFKSNVGDTVAVGSYPPNGYGLHDMAGNVAEWCLDEYNWDFYSVSAVRNPLSGAESIQWLLDNYTGVSVNSWRVLRGGSWPNSASSLRSANRHRYRSYFPLRIPGLIVGFRCVRTVSP